MKNNKGLTLVELIIVMASLGIVLAIVGYMLNSSSKDTYTINDKVQVQNNVTELMNIVQQDIQEAKIIVTEVNGNVTKQGIIFNKNNVYYINTNIRDTDELTGDKIRYTFDEVNRKLVRETGGGIKETFNNIQSFSIEPVEKENYGANVSIVGSKKKAGEDGIDKSRYELNSTFYTRNTI